MTTAEARNKLAELVVLEAYDSRRYAAGHDYGSGQRAHELSRRRRELRDIDLMEIKPDAVDLAAAYRVRHVRYERWGLGTIIGKVVHNRTSGPTQPRVRVRWDNPSVGGGEGGRMQPLAGIEAVGEES